VAWVRGCGLCFLYPYIPRGAKASPNGVDVSKELRRVLLERRDAAMLKAFERGEDDLLPVVFPSETGGPGRRQPSVRKGADGPFEHSSNSGHMRPPDSWCRPTANAETQTSQQLLQPKCNPLKTRKSHRSRNSLNGLWAC